MMKWGRIAWVTNVLVLVVGMGFVFTGCERSSPPPIITPAKPRKKAVQKTSSPNKAAKPKKEVALSYNPTGLADPFKPFVQIGSPGKTVKGLPRTPLQEYDLSQLKLTAIIWTGGADGRAMVEDSAGKGFTLKKGTYIGKRGGKVKAIQLDRVIIEEPIRVFGEQAKTREIVLKMPEEGGKK
jgi:Tfp pilus assembly protein PilP